jgi:hypothetical protein
MQESLACRPQEKDESLSARVRRASDLLRVVLIQPRRSGAGRCQMNPIDLRAEFGHRWDVRLVRSAAGGQHACDQVVVCGNGFLYSVDSNTLGAATHRGDEIVQALRVIDGVEVLQAGDKGAHVIFPRAALRYVQRAMKPRRARKLRPSRSGALTEAFPR